MLLLSLCIPTNGIIEWVLPVLDSIYAQNVDLSLFEVIVADNGSSKEFEAVIRDYSKYYSNLTYKKTTAIGFLNQIECFKLASGKFIKFINHRMPLKDGTVQKFLEISKKYGETKPTVFFTNGTISYNKNVLEFTSFDAYVSFIGYMASRSGGTAFWKDDFENNEIVNYNELFPHLSYVLKENKNNLYIVDNTKVFELPNTDESKKGKYQLYKAFAVELPILFIDLLKEDKISWKTYKNIMRQLEVFIANQYLDLQIEKKACSYDLSNFKEYVSIFFNPQKIIIMAYLRYIKHFLRRRH